MKQFVKILTLLGVAGTVVMAQTPHPQISTSYAAKDRTVLESYSFLLGIPGSPNASAGAELHFKDRFVGNGTAQSSVRLLEQSSSSTLTNRPLLLMLDVKRTVRPGEFVFALLVFGVEIRGYDSNGAIIFSRDLPSFTFGDSASGEWYERIPDLPTNLARLSVTFYGNYE
jgi:hypothetical protein